MRYQDALYDHTLKTTGFPVPYMFHATKASNLSSIRKHGLQTKFYGSVHGMMDIHPPKDAIYLSRHHKTDNLHTGLFEDGPVVVLKIDTRVIDVNEVWPDDFIYFRWTNGELLEDEDAIAKALGITHQEASEVLENMMQATDHMMPLVFQPFWRWYLMWNHGGEIAYTTDIPPEAIIDITPY